MNAERGTKVFAPQIPSKKDRDTGIWVPTINIAPAERFGEVVTLLPPGSQFFAAAETTRLIKQRLHELDYQRGDYIIAIGNPVIIAITSAIAARRSNGSLKVLVWDKHSTTYADFELDNLV